MLKERYHFFRSLLYFEELLICNLNFFLVYFLISRAYHSLGPLSGGHPVIAQLYPLDQYLRAFWLNLVVWAVLLRARGEYHHIRIQTYYYVITTQMVNGFFYFALVSTGVFLLHFEYISRSFLLLYSATTVMELLVNRLLVLSFLYYFRRRGYNYRNLLVVGTGRRAQEFISLTMRHKEWGFRILGLLDRDPEMKGKHVAGHEVLGVLDDLPRLLEKRVVDEVVLVVPRGWLKDVEKCILFCEAVGVPATLSTDFFDLEIARGIPSEMDGFTYVTFQTRRLRHSELLLKRVMDIMLSSALLILSGPVFILTALLVRLSSPGPIFFKQKRVGVNGRDFTLYKFRSMIVGAEQKLNDLKAMNEMSGPVFKMARDPRMTPVGRFIRKFSLDEFPQFWNVLKGDMSLVGPRPPLRSEVQQYEPWQRRRLSMKPGITCIWQVSGRNQINFEDWMRLDLQYIDRWSLWLDLKILLLTARAVLTSRGAK